MTLSFRASLSFRAERGILIITVESVVIPSEREESLLSESRGVATLSGRQGFLAALGMTVLFGRLRIPHLSSCRLTPAARNDKESNDA